MAYHGLSGGGGDPYHRGRSGEGRYPADPYPAGLSARGEDPYGGLGGEGHGPYRGDGLGGPHPAAPGPEASQEDGRPGGERRSGGRRGGRPRFKDRLSGRRRPAGRRPGGERPVGEQPVGERPDGRRPARRPGGRRPEAGRSPGSLPPAAYFAAAGVLVLVAAVVAVAVFVTRSGGGHRKPPPVARVPESGPLPSAYSRASSTSAFAAIARRADDSRPLTSAEVFADRRITDADAKASLRLTVSRIDTRCADAVWGAGLARVLGEGGCTQVARGVYADRHFAAMVTIVNLADAAAADRLVAAADPATGSGFVVPPAGAPPFGQAFGIARGLAMGHYAVITWVRRSDGTGDERDPKLVSLLVTTGRPGAVLTRAARRGHGG